MPAILAIQPFTLMRNNALEKLLSIRIQGIIINILPHSALTLFMARVGTNNAYNILAPQDFAVATQLFNRSPYFHKLFSALHSEHNCVT